MSKIKHYFAGGNTSVGFYSLYDEVIKGLDRLYILKGGPGTGKSSFMKRIGAAISDRGFDVQYYHCSLDNNSLDGVVFPEIKLGFIDGTAPHIIDPKYPGVVDTIINLGEFWDENRLIPFKYEIIHLTNQISTKFQNTYAKYAEAKSIHDEWEEIYLAAMDFNKANEVTNQLIEKIFEGEIPEEENPTIRRIFFGAATSQGVLNYIDNLTEDLRKRYIVKGRPGSGKSTMMKKIGRKAEELGLSVEYYPCGFDPNSLDMVLIPALGVAVLDGTAPHVIDPTRETDEVVDMFELCIETSVDVEKASELNDVTQRYNQTMKEGSKFIVEAKTLHDQLENFYISSMNFDGVNQKLNRILDEVLAYAAK